MTEDEIPELFVTDLEKDYFIQGFKDEKGIYSFNIDGDTENIKYFKSDKEALLFLANMVIKERDHSHNLYCRVEEILNGWEREY